MNLRDIIKIFSLKWVEHFLNDSRIMNGIEAYLRSIGLGNELKTIKFNTSVLKGQVLKIIDESGEAHATPVHLPSSYEIEPTPIRAAYPTGYTCYCGNDRVVFIYDPYYYRVGTITGSTVSWGPARTFAGGNNKVFGVTYHEAQDKVVILYRTDQPDYVKIVSGSLSGDSLILGTHVIAYGETYDAGLWYDPFTEKLIIHYQEHTSSFDTEYGFIRTAKLSGTSVIMEGSVRYTTGYDRWAVVVTGIGFNRIMLRNAEPKPVVRSYYVLLDITGYTPLIKKSLTSTSRIAGGLTFDQEKKKVVETYISPEGSTSGVAYSRVIDTTDDNIILGASTPLSAARSYRLSSGFYDNLFKKHVSASGSGSSATSLQAVIGFVNGGSVYRASESDIYSISSGASMFSSAISAGPGRGLITYFNNAIGGSYIAVMLLEGPEGITAIAQEDGLANEIKEIALLGETSTIASPGTPGKLAFLQEDGTISNAISPFILGRYLGDTVKLTKKPVCGT